MHNVEDQVAFLGVTIGDTMLSKDGKGDRQNQEKGHVVWSPIHVPCPAKKIRSPAV